MQGKQLQKFKGVSFGDLADTHSRGNNKIYKSHQTTEETLFPTIFLKAQGHVRGLFLQIHLGVGNPEEFMTQSRTLRSWLELSFAVRKK